MAVRFLFQCFYIGFMWFFNWGMKLLLSLSTLTLVVVIFAWNRISRVFTKSLHNASSYQFYDYGSIWTYAFPRQNYQIYNHTIWESPNHSITQIAGSVLLLKLVIIIKYNRKRRLDVLKTFFKHLLIVLWSLGKIDLILYSTG